MGRHAPAGSRLPQPAIIGIVVVTVLALTAVVWVVTRPSAEQGQGAVADSCEVTQSVRVTVAPEAYPLARELLSGPVTTADGGGSCAVAEVRIQEPLQTLADLGALDPEAQPQVWVPDDRSWAVRAGDKVEGADVVLGSTPLVLATTQEAADQLGWTTTPPGWAPALSTDRELVLADPVADAESLVALAALGASLGGGPAADTAVTRAVLASGRAPSTALLATLQTLVDGASDPPVVVATEQQVRMATADGEGDLAVVVPAEGTPSLELPVLRTTTDASDTSSSVAVDAVMARLAQGARDGAAVRAAGWRDMRGVGADSSVPGLPVVAPTDLTLPPVAVAALAERLVSLAAPSQLLVAVDVSLSMAAEAGNGTRATLARNALTSTLQVLPDKTIGALWIFASGLDGDQDWRELVPFRPFAADVDGQTQRQVVAGELARLPDLLSGGGTGLNDTTLAAVRAAQDAYDPEAVNSVVLITDGTNEDNGISEADLLATLTAEADPARPVQVIGVGIGPDADIEALQRIAEATGGAAYAAQDPADLQAVLFDAVRQRN